MFVAQVSERLHQQSTQTSGCCHVARGCVAQLDFRRPIFTVREGPSVKKTALAGTCSDKPSKFVA
jgi:hypothetical protein